MSMDNNFQRFLQGNIQGFNPYSAGDKRYGSGIRDAPNIGPVADKSGYLERDTSAKLKRNAILRRLKAQNSGRQLSSEVLSPLRPNW